MSIINDALKKVQQSLDRQKKAAPVSAADPQPRRQEKFSDVSEAIIVASFLGSLFVLATFFLFSPKQNKNAAPLPVEKTSAAQDPTPDALPPDPPPATPAAPRSTERRNSIPGLTLNGIVRMGDGYVALINNKIVKEGDTVGVRKILSIDKDRVKIFDRGETFLLRLEGL